MGIVNILTGRIAPVDINVATSVAAGKGPMKQSGQTFLVGNR